MTKFEDQLNRAYRIIRRSDGVEYRVTCHGHWSDISAIDGSGERDTVKLYGSDGPGRDLLIGASSGHTYLRTAR